MSSSPQVTFVTAYYTFENTPYFNIKPEELEPWSILDIVKTGVQLCLYIGENCVFEPVFESWAQEYAHFRVMPYRVFYKDMFVYRTIGQEAEDSLLPEHRNLAKDTLEYIVYMHSRTEIMEDAISENPWDSTHFAWIDFNMPRLFSKKEESAYLFQAIAKHTFPETRLYLAGCWPKEALPNVASNICWRFCGGFFLGDTKSLIGFAELCREHMGEFLEKYRRITWEVNYWAWLEYEKAHEWDTKCSGTWYRGDHNDSILNVLHAISADTYTVSIADHSQQVVLEYPYMQDFLAGSPSYVEWVDPSSNQTRHLLNTRFMNYWLYPNGYYRFHDPEMVIGNRNLLSELNATTLEIEDYREMGREIRDPSGQVMSQTPSNKRHFSEGLEDIRLFVGPQGNIRFIATNVDYSPLLGRNRMVTGDYNVDTLTCENCEVVLPPEDHGGMEKNWIPILRGLEELFVYRWSPFELGKVNPATNRLEIVERFSVKSWLFGKLRGSTTFVPYAKDPRYLVGVAHFSEEHGPRHYYHLLVLLEKTTLKPVSFSRTFYFEKLTIEFCIGFTIHEGDYVFWVSRFDRDPVRIRIPMERIPIEMEV